MFRDFKVAVLALILAIEGCRDADTEHPIRYPRDVFND